MNHHIAHADVLRLRPEHVPPNAVAMFDPPYSDHVHSNCETGIGAAARTGVRKRSLGFAPLSDELRTHLAALSARCRLAVVFSDWEGLGAWRDAFNAQPGYRYVRVVPWVRWSSPQRTGDRPPSGSEAIIIAGHTGRLQWNGPGNLTAYDEELDPGPWLTHYDESCERGLDKHTTAKPLDLMMRLVVHFTNPGEVVCDWTCGRGTTILAAKLLGRAGLGVECDAEEARLAARRVRESGCLSVRDAERFDRFRARMVAEAADAERRAAATAKVRARNATTG